TTKPPSTPVIPFDSAWIQGFCSSLLSLQVVSKYPPRSPSYHPHPRLIFNPPYTLHPPQIDPLIAGFAVTCHSKSLFQAEKHFKTT
ncbi:MAG TPA: hypothetical protein VIJ93_10820, partial [bacterium]